MIERFFNTSNLDGMVRRHLGGNELGQLHLHVMAYVWQRAAQ